MSEAVFKGEDAVTHRGPRRLGDAIKPIAYASLAILGLMLLAEFALRLFLDGAYLSPPIFTSTLGKSGYGLLPSVSRTVHQSGRNITVTMDRAGQRITPGLPASAPIRLHLVGDSQVFGWGLSDQETISAKLQERLGSSAAVINHGIPGFGPTDYLEVLKSIPPHEPVILIETEENDAAQTYELHHQDKVACSYVARSEGEGSFRCLLMNSRLLQAASVQWNEMTERYHLTPLGFSESSLVAARVLHSRIAALYGDEVSRRRESIMFTVVPWKGRYSTEWLKRYAPPPRADVNAMPTPFRDSLSMAKTFAGLEDSQTLYLEDDTHLSPRGADAMAEAIAPTARLMIGPI